MADRSQVLEMVPSRSKISALPILCSLPWLSRQADQEPNTAFKEASSWLGNWWPCSQEVQLSVPNTSACESLTVSAALRSGRALGAGKPGF